ncbi:cupin domain-containing protein [Engelhardtia mirabilis]|uniref:Cupin domain protein n=1 Tax=Engelhardtia mirabilis TaxID=2528011 RepID=A0A518BP10_9BACT|nr:Cupin domain protein [Planctomycetes bacterium Pla133]QDV03042.1 Cupin domain protein [Planctomycetes bacterium Pla86]
MTDEAKLIAVDDGLKPEGDGWFIVNLRQTTWKESERFGRWAAFEGAERFGDVGVNVHVLAPGQAACLYHRESLQEGFLVLHGEARLIVNGEERRLGQWDYFHCPPGTNHVLVGGDRGPCAVLMIGARRPDQAYFYPVDPVAARYGASAEVGTSSPQQAYGERGPVRSIPSPWPLNE